MPRVTIVEYAPPHTIFARTAVAHNVGKQIPCYINGVSVGLATIVRAVVADDCRSVEIVYDIPIDIAEEDKFRTDQFLL
jgi:hypothetical protein